MLKKAQRLTTEQVSAVIKDGKSFHSTLFTLRILGGQKTTGFAAIMSKKIAKTAVARNLARRRVYEALEISGIAVMIKKGTNATILCKDKVASSIIKEQATDLKTLFMKAGVL